MRENRRRRWAGNPWVSFRHPRSPAIVAVRPIAPEGMLAKKQIATRIAIQKTQTAPLLFNMCRSDPAGKEPTDLIGRLHTPSGSFGPFGDGPVSESAFDHQTGGGDPTTVVSARTLISTTPTTTSREIYVLLEKSAGNYSVELSSTGKSSRRPNIFDATLNRSEFPQLPSPNAFSSFNLRENIWDGATAHNNVCPWGLCASVQTGWILIMSHVLSRGRETLGKSGKVVAPPTHRRPGLASICARRATAFSLSLIPRPMMRRFRLQQLRWTRVAYRPSECSAPAAPSRCVVVALILQESSARCRRGENDIASKCAASLV